MMNDDVMVPLRQWYNIFTIDRMVHIYYTHNVKLTAVLLNC